MLLDSWLKSLRTRSTRLARRRRGARRAAWRTLRLECLEDRMVLSAIFTVTNTQDSGDGSLRWAIGQANAASDPATIVFNIPTSDPGFVDVDSHLPGGDADPDVFVIQIQSALVMAGDYITIDGRSQAAFTGDTNPFGPEIVIDGSLANGNVLRVDSNNNRISRLNIQGGNANGIEILGNDNWIEGNYIGVDATGTEPAPNARSASWRAGVYLNPTTGNLIGTNADGVDDEAERNVISGNLGRGVVIVGGSENTVAGNFIGTDATGTYPIGNALNGILMHAGATHNLIGGGAPGAGNVISGNSIGVQIINSPENFVSGNFIGTDVTGRVAIANTGTGVDISGSSTGNRIGGSSAQHGNVVSGNASHGIRVAANGNSIQHNTIGANGVDGVYLGGDGNHVQANVIGTDHAGASHGGNQRDGIRIEANAASDNLIGGPDPALGNIISGNDLNGVRFNGGDRNILQNNIISDNNRNGISGHQGVANVIRGNLIGSDLEGVHGGNGGVGIHLHTNAGNTIIGGPHKSDRNVIAGNDSVGLWIAGIGGNTIQNNVISGNGDHGVIIAGQSNQNNVFLGNLIGTDATGTAAWGNSGVGIRIAGNSTGNIIGGTDAGSRNVLSGNVSGVWIADAHRNIVIGNVIGTDITGTAAIRNTGHGVNIVNGARDNVIGGNGPEDGNVISGNAGNGVHFDGMATAANVVSGNLIGTDISGTRAVANGGRGVTIGGGSWNNVIGGSGHYERNVISGNGQHGIEITSSNGNQVWGNFVGVDVTGNFALGNQNAGIRIHQSADVLLTGNIISGNGTNGIQISGHTAVENVVQSNRIGTDASGTMSVGNGHSGVLLDAGAAGNLVAGNLVSGNTFSGIAFAADTFDNRVLGNQIGTDESGTAPLGNGQEGVRVRGTGHQIGGPGEGAANTIAFNTRAGVTVLVDTSVGNTIRGNSIHSNGDLGIDLGGDGVTANDPQDADSGPNHLQNYPQVTRVISTAGGTQVIGRLHSVPHATFTLDFYANAQPDPSGHGEGERWLGSWTVTTDAAGDGEFIASLNAPVAAHELVAATATAADGSTSEFSAVSHPWLVADAGGPYVIGEGDPLALDASHSTGDGGLTYRWDLDGDGDFSENVTGSQPTLSWEQLVNLGLDDGPSTHFITVEVSDGTYTALATASLTIDNVAPVASITAPAAVLSGEAVDLVLGASDFSPVDQAAGFLYEIDWNGDGIVDEVHNGPAGLVVNRVFPTAGTNHVSITATDKDGGKSEPVAITVNVIQPVLVDVKPGSSENKVNVRSQGVIPVAILSQDGFDATRVRGESVRLAGVQAERFALEDVNGDGQLDMILHFRTQDILAALGLELDFHESQQVELELTGETFDDIAIYAAVMVEFFLPGKGKR